MLADYESLQWLPLSREASLTITEVLSPPRVTLDSPAHLVMTDFSRIPVAVIEPEALADTANEYMRRRGVRALLVIDSAAVVAGIITATDLLGEKPVQFAHDTGTRRHDIRVADLMTLRSAMAMIEYGALQSMRVGHVVATIREASRQHLLVGEHGPSGGQVRGIFSLRQIAKQLGFDIQPDSFARTFAEMERSLAHSQA